MFIVRESRHRVLDEHNVAIVVGSCAGGRLNAKVRGDSPEDKGVDGPHLQLSVEIGLKEGADAVFYDEDVTDLSNPCDELTTGRLPGNVWTLRSYHNYSSIGLAKAGSQSFRGLNNCFA
jgi:hypothetical protein